MNEPDIARDYQERDVKAAYSVLIELGQVLGAWRDKWSCWWQPSRRCW